MKWRELERKARQKGWKFLRHGGAHDLYYRDNPDNYIKIGRHGSKEVPPPVLEKLKRQIPLD